MPTASFSSAAICSLTLFLSWGYGTFSAWYCTQNNQNQQMYYISLDITVESQKPIIFICWLVLSYLAMQYSPLTLYSTKVVIVPHRLIWNWYAGHWSVGCYIWYSAEVPVLQPVQALPTVPNVTVHSWTPVYQSPYNGLLLCSFNVHIKWLWNNSCQSTYTNCHTCDSYIFTQHSNTCCYVVCSYWPRVTWASRNTPAHCC